MNEFDVCWKYGMYNDDCICDLCPYKDECSGHEDEDD
jgi:hypothetical protein